jgi:hypothetical protein
MCILFLHRNQTRSAQTSVIILAYILCFIQRKRYFAALAFGEGIGLAFKRCFAAFALYGFVFAVQRH